jgi:hypothetical protein
MALAMAVIIFLGVAPFQNVIWDTDKVFRFFHVNLGLPWAATRL